MPTISTDRAALVALLAATCLALAPKPASAGTYVAAVCDPAHGAGHADAAFERTSRRYVSDASCGAAGDGLVVTHRGAGSATGTWGAWSLRAPDGTTFSRLGVGVAGRRSGGHVPELLAGQLHGPLSPLTAPTPGFERVRWSGGAEVLTARLRCRWGSGCARGRRARVRVRRIFATLDDRAFPIMGLAGSLFDAGSRRGRETIAPSAADRGGGVRRFLVQVNGEPLTARRIDCRIAGGKATRLRPCPGRASATIAVATASPPFRQGPNLVRVCAADYAPGNAPNRSCADRRVRVDNRCPISPTPGGAELRAHLPGHRSRLGVNGGHATTVAGRLLSAEGRGVAGARVCVAARVRIDGAIERVIAAPTTGARGRFSAKLPAGPSRELRIAYRPDESTAIERYLALGVRVRPRLRLRPKHAIRNGNRVRFEVAVPGPSRAHRRVRIEVRAGRRWLELRSGLTRASGVYRARYRFHATTGRRVYRFRATVPKQYGYPYEAGRSKLRRATVSG